MYPRVSFGLWEKRDAKRAVEAAVQAEQMGIDGLWLDVSRNVPDPVTFYAAAAWATQSVSLGLAIVPTYPRHPAVLANQAQALYQLGGERIRLGIGPSHQHIVEGAYGLEFDRPLAHLREYLQILRTLTESGRCQFQGEFFRVDVTLDSIAPLPLYVSALRSRALQLAGELADGALTWLAPVNYLRDEGLARPNRVASRSTTPSRRGSTRFRSSSSATATRPTNWRRCGALGRRSRRRGNRGDDSGNTPDKRDRADDGRRSPRSAPDPDS